MKPPPAVSFVGPSGSGKTTLLRKVVAILVRKGYRVGVIKHSSGFADPDRRGKDSWLLRRAGARTLLLASRDRSVLFLDHPGKEPGVKARLRCFEGFDLVLVESWRAAGLPAIRVRTSPRPRPAEIAARLERRIRSKRRFGR